MSDATPAGATMQALELRDYADTPESLRLVERPLPKPAAGYVLVRMAYAAINPSDLLFLRGEYGIKKKLPVIAGFEGSGTVVAAGPGWRGRLLVGRRVACLAGDATDGTWAEYAVIPAERCFPLSDQLTLEQGAHLLVNPLTAWGLLHTARSQGHAAAIQTAAASQLGRMLVRLSERFSYPLINIVRRQAQVELLRAQGAAYVLNSSTPSFASDLRELAQELRATVAFDAVAGAMTGQLLTAMPNHSRVIVYGALDAAPIQLDAQRLVFEDKTLSGFWLAEWATSLRLPELLRIGSTVQHLAQFELATSVQAHIPLSAGYQGVQQYRASMTAGKVVWAMHGAE